MRSWIGTPAPCAHGPAVEILNAQPDAAGLDVIIVRDGVSADIHFLAELLLRTLAELVAKSSDAESMSTTLSAPAASTTRVT
jgi:hypothetical protein